MGRRGVLKGESEEKLNELKMELCRAIDYEVHKLIRAGISKKMLAFELGTSQANLSRAINKKTETLTFNQLFRFLVILQPAARILVSTN